MKVRFGTLVIDFEGVGDLGDSAPAFAVHAAAADEAAHARATVLLDPSAGAAAPWRPGQPMGTCSVADGVLTVERRSWRVRISLEQSGPIELALRGWRVNDFDQALGVLVQVLAPLRAGGLCLHGSSVLRGDEGFAFIASSETGKTTVARLSKDLGHTVLAEEMTYVGWPAGDGRPHVYNLPLRERNDLRTTTAVSAPLDGIYRLVQDPHDVVEPLGRRDRTLELAARAAIGARAPVVMDAALSVIERLDADQPLRRLRFTRSTRFWQAIDDDRRQRAAATL
jgi:hypothetical protein